MTVDIRRKLVAPSKAGRKPGQKTRAGGLWTEARYNKFINSALRSASLKWPPMSQALKDARLRRGIYKCAGCGAEVRPTTRVDGKTKKNVHVDHIVPVVDPQAGFEGWDVYVERLFCEQDNLQVLCLKCHTEKTNLEATERADARRTKESK